MEKGRKDFFLGEAAASCSFLLGVLKLKTIDPSYMYNVYFTHGISRCAKNELNRHYATMDWVRFMIQRN